MDGYILDEGYATVGDFGVAPTSQADCPAGTYYGMLPNGTYTCSPNIVFTPPTFFKTYIYGPEGSFWTKLPFHLAVLSAVGYAGYRIWKKRQATVAGLND